MDEFDFPINCVITSVASVCFIRVDCSMVFVFVFIPCDAEEGD